MNIHLKAALITGVIVVLIPAVFIAVSLPTTPLILKLLLSLVCLGSLILAIGSIYKLILESLKDFQQMKKRELIRKNSSRGKRL